MIAYLEHLIAYLKFIADAAGAVLIGIGMLLALFRLVSTLIRPTLQGYQRTRLVLSRFLILALEFQLASDILSTIISPTWNELGQLAVIATIRTLLNFFLSKEMKEEEGELGVKGAPL